jgi:L-lactate dehydrogenase complex protein LldG
MRVERVLEEVLEKLELKEFTESMENASMRLSTAPYILYNEYPYLQTYEEEVRRAKEEVLKNIDYYIDKSLKSVEKAAGRGLYLERKEEVHRVLLDIIGDNNKLIVKSKSMVTEELEIRGFLESQGHEVLETDLGQFLIQLSGDKPMHTVAPAVHISRLGAIKLLKQLGIDIDEKAAIEDIVYKVRGYLREKFVKADIGISGANVVSADTGSVFLISNEGNIRNTTNLPPIHIAITGIEKIMPNMELAFKQAILQAANAGLYPPTYLSLIAGPSSTADIEFRRVYGVHGPIEKYLILYDGGRKKALENEVLSEQLFCIRCGRCQAECPIWRLVGNIWGGKVYGGPMGMGWTAITEGIEKAAALSHLCLLCGRCREICPMDIDLPRIIHMLKTRYSF